MKVILELIFLFFTVIGMFECCLRVGAWLAQRHRARSLKSLELTLRIGPGDDVEQVVRVALNLLSGLRDQSGRGARITLIDAGMDDEARRICELLCRDYAALRLEGGPDGGEF